MAALACIWGSVLIFYVISRLNRRPFIWAAALGLPVLAALLCHSWHCLLLIPLFLIPHVLDLPNQALRAIPSMGHVRGALIPEATLTQGAPQVVTLHIPFQPESIPLRRKGGNVLFNTAVALCTDVCPDAEGLAAYARAQGFDPARLLARMPRADQAHQQGLTLLCHQDAASQRWFAWADPDNLLPRCSLVLEGTARPLDPQERQLLLDRCHSLRASGQTLYAFACSDCSEGPFTYLGIAGLRPLLRENITAQLKRLQALDAHPILWASSYPERAWTLACECGLVQPGDCLATLEDFAALSDEELIQQARYIRVLQGLDRTHRRRFMHAFQQSGQKLSSLDAEGLAAWEKALLTRRKMEALALRLKKLRSPFTYLPCAGIAIGAAINLWPISLLALVIGLGAWGWLFCIVRHSISC